MLHFAAIAKLSHISPILPILPIFFKIDEKFTSRRDKKNVPCEVYSSS